MSVRFKYIFVLFFLIITASFFARAQTEWAPIGARWSNERNDFWMDILYYTSFKSVKDTLVLNKNCRKIEIYEFVNERTNHKKYSRNSGFYIMYNDSEKVYYLQNNKFRLLYDFSLKKGDTLFSSQPIEFDTTISVNRYIIDSVKTIQISGKQLRSQYLHMIDPLVIMHQGYYVFLEGSIIERIGYSRYLFGLKVETEESPGPYFKCYQDSEIFYIAGTDYNCDGLNGINDAIESEAFKIYPNPVTDELILDYSGNEIFNVKIVNSLGKMLYQKTGMQGNSNVISTSSLPSGIYYLILFNDRSAISKIFSKL